MIESASYKKVLSQLRIFIRKYYLNKSLQGLLVLLLIMLLGIGAIIIGNQGLRLNAAWRTAELQVFGLMMVLLVVILVLVPLLKMAGIIKGLNYKKAERIISSHFPDMKDTLLNMLELAGENENNADKSLLIASIEDKANRIKWYRFSAAVPMRRLLKFVIYFVSVVVLSGIVYFVWPDFVREGYSRTINYRTDFDLPPVYNYQVLNDSLVVALGRDLEVRVKPLFETEEEKVYLRMGQNREAMLINDEGIHTHTIRALNAGTTFRLQYRGIMSEPYEVRVIPTPELVQFTLQTFPPAYTNIEGQVLNNEGDLDIPAGTKVVWNINAMYTDNLLISFGYDTLVADKDGNRFSLDKRLMQSGKYKIVISNLETDEKPELGYNIRVRPDLYPEIDVNEVRDSLIETQFFFQGFISDDYGFSKLQFIVERMDGSNVVSDEMIVNEKSMGMRFYHARDMADIGVEGEQLYYYFSVWDNDGVNGAKRTDSRKMAYRNLTYSELVDQNKERADKIEETMNKGKDITEKLKEKVEEMKMSQLMEEKEDWEMRSRLKEMQEMQNLLDEMINNIKEENRIKGVEQDKFNLENQRLVRKQEEIQELLEKIMDDELKKLLEEFEKLVEEMNKGEKLERLEEMDMNLENLERQLDVSMELLKRYEVEKEVFRTANELEKMAEELERMDQEKDSLGMEEMKEEFEKLDENYKEQLEKNQELKDPMKMEDFEEEREDIRKDMEEMTDPKKGNQQKEEKKKSAEKKMKELSDEMKGMMMSGGGEQDQVDLEILRQLMRELNDFSFKQEELIEVVARVNINNPEYAKAGVEERELKEKFTVIRDSLVSLGYKQPVIASLLNEELFHVETSLENIMIAYQNERKSQVGIEQQNIMKGANELAVRIDEMVQSFQMQSGEGQGQSSFTDSNPKSGKDKIGDMKGKQQSLKEQLEGMIQEMKEGGKGKKDKKGLAQMLAEREMMRQAIEKLKNSGELGEDSKGKLTEIQKLMEEVEKDIIYDRLGDHTIKREKLIETKLLEAENAEMEREMENKRESTEFKGTIKPPDQKVWEQFEQEKKKSLDLMKYRDIKLKEFYRKKYFDYLEQLEKQKK